VKRLEKKLIPIPAVALASVLILMFALVFSFAGTRLVLASPGWTADSYGNTLVYVEVWQFHNGSWVLRGNLTDEGSVKIFHNEKVNFTVCVKANATLIPEVSSDYIRVFMNITHQSGTKIWELKELNYTSHTTTGGFHYIKYEGVWISSLPEEGVTYNCAVDYRQYY